MFYLSTDGLASNGRRVVSASRLKLRVITLFRGNDECAVCIIAFSGRDAVSGGIVTLIAISHNRQFRLIVHFRSTSFFFFFSSREG